MMTHVDETTQRRSFTPKPESSRNCRLLDEFVNFCQTLFRLTNSSSFQPVQHVIRTAALRGYSVEEKFDSAFARRYI